MRSWLAWLLLLLQEKKITEWLFASVAWSHIVGQFVVVAVSVSCVRGHTFFYSNYIHARVLALCCLRRGVQKYSMYLAGTHIIDRKLHSHNSFQNPSSKEPVTLASCHLLVTLIVDLVLLISKQSMFFVLSLDVISGTGCRWTSIKLLFSTTES